MTYVYQMLEDRGILTLTTLQAPSSHLTWLFPISFYTWHFNLLFPFEKVSLINFSAEPIC